MLVALLLAAALALVAHGLFASRSFPQRFADLIGRTTRPRAIAAWALGTWVTWGLSALFALVLLGRSGDIVALPAELTGAAWALGLPGFLPWRELGWLGLGLGGGVAIGVVILALRRWRGRGPGWVPYRSAATAEHASDVPAAALLALSAGVSEELFFRLLLPLLVALVTGSGLAGVAVGLGTFVVLHRHQGWLGLTLVALIGVALTYLYLLTGRLWIAMLVHTIVDLNAFVVRPWIAGFRTSSANRS